jgi:hypothetical protein
MNDYLGEGKGGAVYESKNILEEFASMSSARSNRASALAVRGLCKVRQCRTCLNRKPIMQASVT